MQILCKNCKNKNICKEIENYDEYCKNHIELKTKKGLFNCDPMLCCLFERELFTDTHVVIRDGEPCVYVKKSIYDDLKNSYDNLQKAYKTLKLKNETDIYY